jgi:hypothetical protein
MAWTLSDFADRNSHGLSVRTRHSCFHPRKLLLLEIELHSSKSDLDPIAEYTERPIDSERRDQILNAPDAIPDGSGTANKGGQ